ALPRCARGVPRRRLRVFPLPRPARPRDADGARLRGRRRRGAAPGGTGCPGGASEYCRYQGQLDRVTLTALDFEGVVGGLTFTGSLIAAAKLQELMRGRPITYRGQNVISMSLLGIFVASAA